MIDVRSANAGAAVFFDGRTSARHAVQVRLRPERVEVESADGRLLAEWSYAEIEGLNAPEGALRLGRRGNALLERLVVSDPSLASALGERAIQLDRSGRIGRRQRLAVAAAGMLAMSSLVLLAWIGVPTLAARLTPFIPLSLERKLGAAVDLQVRAALDPQKRGAQFECGLAPHKLPAKLALSRLQQRLATAAALDIPLHLAVLRRKEPNAIALPGGQIYVFQGLIERADTADQLAAVLAHEIGHVAHRDGTRAVLQGAGLSFLFGMALGDFVGGGAVMVAARTLLNSSYSRQTEAAADSYGVQLILKAGGDGRALATILNKIGGATEPGMRILRDHPDTKARIAAIERLAPARSGGMLLDAHDWAALRMICED